MQALRATGRVPEGLPIAPFKGHAYVVRRQAPRRLAGPGFCLVGDAAGLARDLCGEGIGPAIRSGSLAAEAVASGPARGPVPRWLRARGRALYGPGEPCWLGRRIGRLPTPCPAAAVRVVLGSARARRRIVFDSIFGMKEEAVP